MPITSGMMSSNSIEYETPQWFYDMLDAQFRRKYVLYMPGSLYDKEKKFLSLLRMIDDEYARAHVVILLTFKELISNKQFIKKIKKEGYKLAVTLDKETTLAAKEKSILYFIDYIYVNKKAPKAKEILAYIPDDLVSNIIYDDIINKVGDLGGE